MPRTIFKFRLQFGHHILTDARGYSIGQVREGDEFESTQPLDEMFNEAKRRIPGMEAITNTIHSIKADKFLRLGERIEE